MKRFNVFPKKGIIFSITIQGFSLEGERSCTILSMKRLTTVTSRSIMLRQFVLPTKRAPTCDDVRCFEVHLKGRSEPKKGVRTFLQNGS
jgi:hypothetical protein